MRPAISSGLGINHWRRLADRQPEMGDRRFATRVPCTDSVDLRWQDQSGQTRHGAAQLADISASGASLRVEQPLQVGITLLLVYRNEEFPAKVKYCLKRGSAYLMGIEFQAGQRRVATATPANASR